ncbi:MAG: alpha/beta fold hydrolase [Flavobacteriaceae bacterium]|nr:alpha/beta fold hydrolase [Flavobacteriaceae bacterium]
MDSKKSSLHYEIRQPKIPVEHPPLLILLHGYGSNELDLFSFADELPDELLIISARAPMSLGYHSYAWYSINFDEINGKFSNIAEAEEARETIAAFIDEMTQKYQVNKDKIFLLGFSQGTILSYSIALKYPEKVKYVIALSGYINEDLAPGTIQNRLYRKLDFFISHGNSDQVLPVEWARMAPEILNILGIKNVYKEYNAGHGVHPQNFYDLKNWISERLKS